MPWLQRTSIEKPGDSKYMLHIRDVVLPYQGDDCLVWPFPREPTGYASFVRGGKKTYVHRVACETRNGPPPTPKHHAAHTCNNGTGGCVNPKHLTWKTNSENQKDRIDGTPWPRSKLSDEQVQEIRALRGIEPVNVTAARYGVSVTHTKHIQTGRARTTGPRPFTPIPADTVNAIRVARGRVAEIAARHGVTRFMVYGIRNGRTYRHVPPFSSGEQS